MYSDHARDAPLALAAVPLVLACLAAPPLPAQHAEAPGLAVRLRGTWSSPATGQTIRFDGAECVVAHRLRQTLMTVEYDADGSRIVRAVAGSPEQPVVSRIEFTDDEHAKLVGQAHTLELTRIAAATDPIPEAVSIEPMRLGTRDPAADEVAAIREQLESRREREQDIREQLSQVEERVRARLASEGRAADPFSDPEMQDVMSRMMAIDDANTRYVKDLMADVGWIDAARFGDAANDAAFLIVQHCGNLALLRAVTPALKAEFDAGRAPQGPRYALMYDRLTLALGGRQRYGSQLLGRPDGSLYFPRLEDPATVDLRRRTVGLGTLADYAKRFDGAPVQMPEGYVEPDGGGRR